MDWALLVIAGLLECGWAIGLKFTDGFTRLVPTLLTLVALIVSMGLLGVAVRTIPVGTGYAVWTGIGAVGTATLGILLLGEPINPWRIAFLTLIVIGIFGLKFSA